MSDRIRFEVPPRVRRTQAERTSETRERILAAVVESIAEIGYRKTTASVIARRAGVSWGAIQHHFGDKDGIFLAAVQVSFNGFADLLMEAIEPGLSLRDRVSLFVDRSWKHFGSAHYRSTYEILMNLPPGLEPTWQSEVLTTWNRIWTGFFPERPAKEKENVVVMRYMVSVLSGLATMNTFEGAPARSRMRELQFLKDTLEHELAMNGAIRK